MNEQLKLYLVSIDNGLEYGDYEEKWKLVVARDKNHATILAVKFLLETYELETTSGFVPGYHIEEVNEVDGYFINVIKQQKEND